MDTHDIQPTTPQVHPIVPGIIPRGKPIALSDVAVLLHPRDNVAIARVPLNRNVLLLLPPEIAGDQPCITVTQRILSGHKVALRAIDVGQPILRYGSIIGYATQPIPAGAHVHSHNLAVGELKQDYQFGVDVHPFEPVAAEQRRTFLGYRRPDGKAGTRNYIAIISSVNCSASTVRLI